MIQVINRSSARIISPVIARRFYRCKIKYFKLAKAFNLTIPVFFIFFLIEKTIYSRKLGYYNIFWIIIFRIVGDFLYRKSYKLV